MNIQKAEIVMSAVSSEQYPNEGWPELAIAGRSNVGKSSFINSLLNRKSLARTSSKPGKTRTINFYNIEDRIHLVDVPGYGYAKVSKKEREKWAKMMDEYFSERDELMFVILLVDIRHEPSQQDIDMYQYLKYYELPVVVLATKQDKISKNKLQQHLARIENDLGMHEEDPLLAYSSVNHQGREEVWELIQDTYDMFIKL